MSTKFGFETTSDRDVLVEKTTKKVASEADRIRPILLEILEDYRIAVKDFYIAWPYRPVFDSKIEEYSTKVVGREGAFSVRWALGKDIHTGGTNENEDGIIIDLSCDPTITYISFYVHCGGCFRNPGKLKETLFEYTGLKNRIEVD